MNDIINIEILEDGRIKITTDKIGQANHTCADNLLEEIARLMGGEVIRAKRSMAHTHQAHQQQRRVSR